MRKAEAYEATYKRNAFGVGDDVEVTRDDGTIEVLEVNQPPWQLGDGSWVIGLRGIRGGVALERVRKP